MKYNIIIVIAFTLLSLSSSADPLVDAKTGHQTADKELNTVYQQAKKILKKEEFQLLQKDQRGWLEGRDWNAEFQARDKPIDTSTAYWEAMQGYTEERVEFLKAWITVTPKETWEGEYKDCAGGTLIITKKAGVLTFSIDVVRGPTFHLGEIKGALSTNIDKARFSDHGDPDYHDPGGTTWLDFKQLGDGLQIKISGTNTQPYHGARAYFDGTYRRIK